MARVNKDDPEIQAVVQKAVDAADKASAKAYKAALKELRTDIKERLKLLAEDLRSTEGGRTAGAIAVVAAKDIDGFFKKDEA